MKIQPTEPSALTIWFNRQRRAWWRVNWLMLLSLAVLLLGLPRAVPALFSHYMQVNRGLIAYYKIPVYLLMLSPAFYLVFLLFAVWQVARLGRHYMIPADLLVASSPQDCNRAFLAVFRKDVYLVYGVLMVIPVLWLAFSGLLSTVLNTVIYGDWLLFIGALVFYLGQLCLLCELTVYLHTTKRRSHPAVHMLLPILYLVTMLFLLPWIIQLVIQLAGSGGTTAEVLQFMLSVVVSVLCFILAWRVYRLSYVPGTGRDAWREG